MQEILVSVYVSRDVVEELLGRRHTKRPTRNINRIIYIDSCKVTVNISQRIIVEWIAK